MPAQFDERAQGYAGPGCHRHCRLHPVGVGHLGGGVPHTPIRLAFSMAASRSREDLDPLLGEDRGRLHKLDHIQPLIVGSQIRALALVREARRLPVRSRSPQQIVRWCSSMSILCALGGPWCPTFHLVV
jgi:hypothetical protein